MKKLALPIRFGLVICACLIAFFLLLSLFGAHTNPIYSLFNAIITGFGIYEAIKYTKIELGPDFDYAKGFGVGLLTGFVATILFTVFFTFYATEIEPGFLLRLLSVFKGEYNVGIGLVSFVVAIMGFATTVVLTLTFMQIFKNSNNIVQNH
ncbi:DUF4199 domain-containing protein [Mangrovimonas aestuarii]|uniref:DUF4199 domain-containing protein n=1 Tax=Mangrovimonas aestuarii TaxID=3018443 RepID=UPI0023783CD6|nr:DUF4199 domain-containing protein [Mangrovimonas aestuarii]